MRNHITNIGSGVAVVGLLVVSVQAHSAATHKPKAPAKPKAVVAAPKPVAPAPVVTKPVAAPAPVKASTSATTPAPVKTGAVR